MSTTYAHDPWLAMGHWELLSCRKLGCRGTSRCAGSLFTCSSEALAVAWLPVEMLMLRGVAAAKAFARHHDSHERPGAP